MNLSNPLWDLGSTCWLRQRIHCVGLGLLSLDWASTMMLWASGRSVRTSMEVTKAYAADWPHEEFNHLVKQGLWSNAPLFPGVSLSYVVRIHTKGQIAPYWAPLIKLILLHLISTSWCITAGSHGYTGPQCSCPSRWLPSHPKTRGHDMYFPLKNGPKWSSHPDKHGMLRGWMVESETDTASNLSQTGSILCWMQHNVMIRVFENDLHGLPEGPSDLVTRNNLL